MVFIISGFKWTKTCAEVKVCRVSDSHTHTYTQVWWANWTSENSKRNDTQKPHNREDKRAREEKGKKSKFGFRLKADLSL